MDGMLYGSAALLVSRYLTLFCTQVKISSAMGRGTYHSTSSITLVEKMVISGSTLHRIELEQQNVTNDTLEQIMDRLKVSMAGIFPDLKK
jgi:transcriptional regulator with XRE-family HTH domain